MRSVATTFLSISALKLRLLYIYVHVIFLAALGHLLLRSSRGVPMASSPLAVAACHEHLWTEPEIRLERAFHQVDPRQVRITSGQLNVSG